ncbi:MAG: DUF4382 domain-containing protein [Microbacter sp.]
MKALKFLMMSFVLVLLASCSTSTKPGTADGSRNVAFLVTDAPMWYNFKAVNVDIQGIDYQVVGDSSNWHALTPFNQGVYNLKALQNGFFKQLGQLQLPNIQLIKKIRLTLGSNNSVVLADSTSKPLSIWGNQNTVTLNINQRNFSTGGDSIMVDFNLARSIVYMHNGYVLKPVLRAFITNQSAALDGFLTPDTLNCKVAYKVYIIYNGDTITTATDTRNHNHFRLMGLPADSSYTVQIVPINGGSQPYQVNITINKNGYIKIDNLAQNWYQNMLNWQKQWWNEFFKH